MRFRAMLVAVLASALLAVAAPAAHAAVPSAANPKFCKAVSNISSDIGGKPTAAKAKIVLKALVKAGKYAPGNVKSALKTLSDYYNATVNAGTDSGKLGDLAKLAPKYSKAATTFATYYVKACAEVNITVPTTIG